MKQSRQLLISFCSLSLVMLLLFILIYAVLMGKMEEAAISANVASHSQVQRRLEDRIGEFENMTSYCAKISDLRYMLSGERIKNGDTIMRCYSVKEALPNYSLTNSDLLGYYLYSRYNDIAFSNSRVSMFVSRYYDREFAPTGMSYGQWRDMMQNDSMTTKLLPAQNIIWQGVTGRCVQYICPILSDSSLNVVGRGVFFIRESAVLNPFQEALSGNASYVCLCGSDGTVLTGSGNDALLQAVNIRNLSDGTVRLRSHGNMLIVMKTTSDMGFSCLSIIERKTIERELRTVRVLLYAGMIILICISTTLCMVLTRGNSRQLREMLHALQTIGLKPAAVEGNELKLLNNFILEQHTANEEYQKELQQRTRWNQNMLLERLLDGRKADPMLLSELEMRCPCQNIACTYILLQGDAYYDAQRFLEDVLNQFDRIPYYRAVSERKIQLVYLAESQQNAVDFFRNLVQQVMTTDVRLCAFIGPFVHSFLDLPISARNAQREIMLHDSTVGDSVVLCREYPEVEWELVYTQDMERHLMQCCLQGDADEGRQLLETIQASAIAGGIANRLTTQMLVTGIVNTLLKTLNDLPRPIEKEQSDWVMKKAPEIVQSQSLSSLFEFAQQCVHMFALHCQKVKSENISRRIHEIDQYIHIVYGDANLHLSTLAEHFGLTEHYLSEFYKRYAGINLSNAIENIRLDHGRQLLQTGVSVNDTAQQVGYINVNTFRRAYRRRFGVNPSEEA